MRSVLGLVLAVFLWAVPCVALGQEKGKPEGEAEAHQYILTVKPSEAGCAVALSTKVGKALGTPEGLSTPTHGETGQAPISSLITCMCGAQMESKACPQGGTCACSSPGGAPAVVCN
jgi:hypothetical protein